MLNFFSFFQSKPSGEEYVHGTNFNSLYLMSRVPAGQGKNELLSSGELFRRALPHFSGECVRGIMDSGINQEYSSWASKNDVDQAIRYASASFNSQSLPQKIQEILEEFNGIIEDYDKNKDEHPRFVPNAVDGHSSVWNPLLLKIRRCRAWDDAGFQREYVPKLREWINYVIPYFKENGLQHNNPDVYKAALLKMEQFKKELDAPSLFTLTEHDKRALEKNYPIVFVTRSECPDISTGGEFGFKRRILGVDIKLIATTPERIEDVQAHLRMQGLANKIKVISLEIFKGTVM